MGRLDLRISDAHWGHELLPLPSTGRGPGWEAGQDMGDTLSQDMGDTLSSCSFLSCREAAALVPPAKRLDGMVGDRDSADGKRGFELQFALPIVRVGAQSPGIPQGGPGGSTLCFAEVASTASSTGSQLRCAVPSAKLTL